MTILTKVGAFNIDTALTATQTQSITGIGFQPKIIIVFWSGSTLTTDGVPVGDYSFGFGAAMSSSSRFYVSGASDDNNATSVTARAGSNALFIRFFPNGGTTSAGQADFTSMDADGFTITINEQFTAALRVNYIALAGTDLQAKIGIQTMPTVTGNYSVTGVGFQPDALITATSSGSNNTNVTNMHIGLGMATDATHQAALAVAASHGAGTSTTWGYGYWGELVAAKVAASITQREALVSMDADGFTMNHLEGTNSWVYYYIALQGGQYNVGNLSTRTDTNDIAVTTGFQPKGLLMFSTVRALSTQDVGTGDGRLTVGVATSATERASQALWDANGLPTTDTNPANSDSEVFIAPASDAIQSQMDIKSIDASGFTAIMDTVEPSSGKWVAYMAIGALATATKIQRLPMLGVG